MKLPEFLDPLHQQAQKLLDRGCIKQIEFSGSTYQIQVTEGKKEAWAFLQLDEKGQLKDSFCSCEEAEDLNSCVHVAAAYLRIFQGQNLPIHKRFERSLWNQLCRIYADRLGYTSEILKSSGRGQYTVTSPGRKQIFYVKSKSSEALHHLKDLLFHRQNETEETSLKFSNLSPEEIILWKEGRPSSQLSYELSFWNDLAKWMMLMQDTGDKYSINFEYSQSDLPNFITIHFSDLELGFYLSEANLPLIIPALATVHSPLIVHNVDIESIQRILFDKEEGCLLIESKETEKAKHQHLIHPVGGHLLDGWQFIPNDGFYSVDQQGLLAAPKLCGEKIGQALTEHMPLIHNLLEGATIHEQPVQASYHLDFDSDWNLHLVSYVFAPGDLTSPGSHYLGSWVYLDDDGFYRLEGQLFHAAEKVIPADDIPHFIQQNRTWLNSQEGFQTHVASIEAQMTYQLSSDNQLSFSRKVSVPSDAAESKDFGPWVYVPGQGFYSKVSAPIGLSWRPGMTLNADQIPLFIRMNAEELKLVPGFFSRTCPVTKSGIKIGINEDQKITINPEYEFLSQYRNKEVKFFDDYVYVEDEGFHELPVDSRLPERVRHPSVIEGESLPLFLNYELDGLKEYATFIDPRLIKPETLKLVATSIMEADATGKGIRSGIHSLVNL